MLIVDANVILRYLLNDILKQAKSARKAIESGAESTIEAIMKMAYVLQSVYDAPRKTAARTLFIYAQALPASASMHCLPPWMRMKRRNWTS